MAVTCCPKNLAMLVLEPSSPEYFSNPRREIDHFFCYWRKVTAHPSPAKCSP